MKSPRPGRDRACEPDGRLPRSAWSLGWMALDLDHRACFLLVHVDNVSSFEMILDTSGMPRHEAMRVLCDLQERGIIAV